MGYLTANKAWQSLEKTFLSRSRVVAHKFGKKSSKGLGIFFWPGIAQFSCQTYHPISFIRGGIVWFVKTLSTKPGVNFTEHKAGCSFKRSWSFTSGSVPLRLSSTKQSHNRAFFYFLPAGSLVLCECLSARTVTARSRGQQRV